jgi:electron transport complex protein RnfE
MREILGHGTLLANAQFLFGEAARNWQITLAQDYGGFLLAILPPGAFMGLGLLVALRNWLANREGRRAVASTESETAAV